jgi:hypothetical protein
VGELVLLGAAGAAGAVAAWPSGGQRVIIDLAAPEFIGCDALGALLRGQKLARRAGRAVLASPREPALRVLGLTPDRPVVRPSRSRMMTADASPGCRGRAGWLCSTKAGLLVWLRVAGCADA